MAAVVVLLATSAAGITRAADVADGASQAVTKAAAAAEQTLPGVGNPATAAGDDSPLKESESPADAAADGAAKPAPRAAEPAPPRRRSSLPEREITPRGDRKGEAGPAAERQQERERERERERAASDARDEARSKSRDAGVARKEASRRDPCAESSKGCREALQLLRDDDIAFIDLDIRVGGTPGNDYPCECRLEGEVFRTRRFASTTMTWKAAGYCHKPLFFEDWELERYGHSRGMFLDPFIAGAHFFTTLPILPYQAGMQAPWECVYPLGYYRPGDCAPWTVPAVPYSPRGFAVEAATVTGLVFLLP